MGAQGCPAESSCTKGKPHADGGGRDWRAAPALLHRCLLLAGNRWQWLLMVLVVALLVECWRWSRGWRRRSTTVYGRGRGTKGERDKWIGFSAVGFGRLGSLEVGLLGWLNGLLAADC